MNATSECNTGGLQGSSLPHAPGRFKRPWSAKVSLSMFPLRTSHPTTNRVSTATRNKDIARFPFSSKNYSFNRVSTMDPKPPLTAHLMTRATQRPMCLLRLRDSIDCDIYFLCSARYHHVAYCEMRTGATLHPSWILNSTSQQLQKPHQRSSNRPRV